MAGNVVAYTHIPKSMAAPKSFMIGRPQNTERARFLAAFNEDFLKAREAFDPSIPIRMKGCSAERFICMLGPQKTGFETLIRAAISLDLKEVLLASEGSEEANEYARYAQVPARLHAINNSLPFEDIGTMFMDKKLFEEGGHGKYLSFLNTALIRRDLSPKSHKFISAVTHETLHGNSFGFGPVPLDEGATRFFTSYIMRHISVPMFFQDLAEEHEKKDFFRAVDLYGIWGSAIEGLKNVVGMESLSDAYFRGDESGILTKIGTGKWRAIKDLAFRYPLKQRGAGLKYLEDFLAILGVPMGQLAEQNNPLLLRPSVKILG